MSLTGKKLNCLIMIGQTLGQRCHQFLRPRRSPTGFQTYINTQDFWITKAANKCKWAAQTSREAIILPWPLCMSTCKRKKGIPGLIYPGSKADCLGSTQHQLWLTSSDITYYSYSIITINTQRPTHCLFVLLFEPRFNVCPVWNHHKRTISLLS